METASESPAEHLRTWSTHAVTMGEALARYRVDHLTELAPTPSHRALLTRDAPHFSLCGTATFTEHYPHSVAARTAITALSLAPFAVTAGTVIADESAAWIWAGGTPPTRIVINAPERLRVPNGIRSRQARLYAGDVIDIAGCPVMAPHRAFAELVTRRDNPQGHKFAYRLLTTGWLQPEELRSRGRRARKAQRAAGPGAGKKRWGATRYYALSRTARKMLDAGSPTPSA